MQGIDQALAQTDPAPARRDFLGMTAATMAVLGSGAFAWTLMDSLNPALDVERSLWIDLGRIPLGGRAWFEHRPSQSLVYVVHRTAEQIAALRREDWMTLVDPQPDQDRVQQPEWLIVDGHCTHDGLPLMGQGFWQDTGYGLGHEWVGNWGGWKCWYCVSEFDLSGRVRKGRAKMNLAIPPHRFEPHNRLLIG